MKAGSKGLHFISLKSFVIFPYLPLASRIINLKVPWRLLIFAEFKNWKQKSVCMINPLRVYHNWTRKSFKQLQSASPGGARRGTNVVNKISASWFHLKYSFCLWFKWITLSSEKITVVRIRARDSDNGELKMKAEEREWENEKINIRGYNVQDDSHLPHEVI